MERLSIRYSWLDMHNSNQLDFSKFLIMESKNPTKSCNEWAALANRQEPSFSIKRGKVTD